jgi:SAM-dependent methyltransferase
MSLFKNKKNRKIDSKEVGLEAGLMVFKFFLKTEYLHYGYFIDGLETDVTNLKKAQENYTAMLISNIPSGTKTILDVGCGSGKTAQVLSSKGFRIDCVSPSQLLTSYARKITPEQVQFYQCKFENLVTDKKYDLVMFSESFQYIPMDKSIPNAKNLLNKGGHIIVSDFFNNDPERKSKLGGGHDYTTWLRLKETFGIKTLVENDITSETAPTIGISDQFYMEVLKPVWSSVWALVEDKFPFVVKLVRRLYRKKLDKMEKKHFSGEINAENFIKYKKYMFYLFQVQ